MEELVQYNAVEQADLVRRREVSSEQLLDAHLRQIERSDRELNAFVQLFERWARRRAKQIDGSRSSWPEQLPSFWGVPFGIKDSDPMRWTSTRLGSAAFKWVVTPIDGPAVRRLRAAGFVMLGKTATSEFALMPVVEPDIHPPTRNPHDPQHSSGGSSGGAAAAVASRMLPIAHGSDGGGSIRIPAAVCGLFGFKASRGLMPNFYAPFESVGISVTGALSRTVEGSAAVIDALRGIPYETEQGLRARSRLPVKDSLRVRFTTESHMTNVLPEIAAAVVRVAAVLESMGHEVEEGVPADGEIAEFVPVYGRLAANVPVVRESALQPVTRWLREIGRTLTREDANQINRALSARIRDWFGDADIWVLPTLGQGAPRVGQWTDLPPEEQFHAAAEMGSFTAPFNITGQPAASIPVGRTASGLPIGVQIVGRPSSDELVLRLAQQLHDAGVWEALDVIEG